MSWHTWDTVSDGRARPGSPITVVARKPDHLDLFATGKDGLVKTTWGP